MHISLCDNVSFDHPRRKHMYNCWNSLPTSVVRYIYKYFLLGDHGDIKTGSTYKIGWGNVEFSTIHAYFGVGTYLSHLTWHPRKPRPYVYPLDSRLYSLACSQANL